MRILYISNDLSAIGGIEKYNSDFINALETLGCSVRVVQRKSGGVEKKILFLIILIFEYFRFRPEFVHCSHLNFSLPCFLMKHVMGVDYSLALYGIEISDLKNSFKARAASSAVSLIVISEFYHQRVLEFLPQSRDIIFMLPSSVDGRDFFPKNKSQNLLSRYGLIDRPVVLSLARLSTHEYKGQDRVLQAMPKVLDAVPNAVYLVVGGGNDERVDAFLKSHPELKNHVTFTGAVSGSERVDFYNLADVYVLPSKFEGFGIVFIESLACGVPVIASDGYGCRAGLLDGELGLLVPPDDIDEIANSIVLMLTGKAPIHLYDKLKLREKTLEVYGTSCWIKRVSAFVKLISSERRGCDG